MDPLFLGSLFLALQGDQSRMTAENFVNPGPNRVVWVSSPNYNSRPTGTVIDTIVLHHTAGPTLSGTVKWFANEDSRVSAHFTIGKDGSIVQHVSTFERAWHAGVSRDRFGRENVNHFSVGIELVNTGSGEDPWTEPQIEAVGNLCAVLKRRFPQIRQITSHEYIALPHGRKPDPKGFPWERLQYLGIELVP